MTPSPQKIKSPDTPGDSHSIVPSNVERVAAFARTPPITAVASAEEAEDGSALLWSREFRDLTDIWWTDDVVSPPSSAAQAVAVVVAVESLQAVLHRPPFHPGRVHLRPRGRVRAAGAHAVPGAGHAEGGPGVRPAERGAAGARPGSTLRVLESADPGYAVTLEDSAELVAGILREFAEQHGRPRSLP